MRIEFEVPSTSGQVITSLIEAYLDLEETHVLHRVQFYAKEWVDRDGYEEREEVYRDITQFWLRGELKGVTVQHYPDTDNWGLIVHLTGEDWLNLRYQDEGRAKAAHGQIMDYILKGISVK